MTVTIHLDVGATLLRWNIGITDRIPSATVEFACGHFWCTASALALLQ